MPRDYRQLKVFHAADDFVIQVYDVSREFPREEIYALTSQMRRAAVSVPANIVEGASRTGEKEFLHFLNIAYGSLAEVGYYIHLAARLGYIAETTRTALDSKHDEISRMLNGLMRSFKRD